MRQRRAPLQRRAPVPLIGRAAAFRAVAGAMAYPAPGHAARITRQLRQLSAPDRDTARALTRARSAWHAADEDQLRAEYTRLFLGNARVSLHETAYGDGRRIAGRAIELADIAGFYTAFGLRLSEDEPDLPDHIAAELEFCSLLMLKLAWDGGRGRGERIRVVERALRRFLEDHLGRWAGALATEVRNHGTCAPYRAAADLIEALVADEVRRWRARPSSLHGGLPNDIMREDEITCPVSSAETRSAPAPDR